MIVYKNAIKLELPFKQAKCKFNTADLTSPADELATHSIKSTFGMLYTFVYFLDIISATLFKASFKPVGDTPLNLK